MASLLSVFVLAAQFSVLLPADATIFDPFELDGNALDSPAGAPDDFQNVFNGTTTGAVASAFTSDLPSVDTGYFKGGGSKDVNDIGLWAWANSPVPDKNEMTNFYAATYLDPVSGHMLLNLGLDRYGNNGAASFGFWLLQQPVVADPGGSFVNSGTGLPAAHEEGDMLVVTDFAGSGAPTVRIFFWQGGGLVLDNTVVNDCRTALPTDYICGSANTGPEPAPWPYESKSGSTASFPVDSFLETAIDLNSLVTTPLGCINTIVAESRSSNRANAQQKDLAIQQFSSCGISMSVDGPALSKETDSVTFDYTVVNTGAIELTLDSVVDDVFGDMTADATAACGTLAPDSTCAFSSTGVVSGGSFPGSLTNTTTITFIPPNGVGTVEATASHSIELFSPSLTIEKSVTSGATVVGVAEYANPGDTLTYLFTLTNNSIESATLGAPDLIFADTVTPIDDGYINDDVLGALRTAAEAAGCDRIATGASCTFSFDYTLAAGDVDTVTDTITNTIEALYHPEGFPNQITATDGHTVYTQPDLFVTKDDGAVTAGAGDTIIYTVAYGNSGHANAAAVVLTETVPPNTTFNSASSTAGWSCSDGAAAGSLCTFALGAVADGTSGTVAFAVTVDATLPAGVDDTTNTVTIADDDARPDRDDSNEAASDTTPLDAAPDLTLTKTDGTDDPTPGTVAVYSLSYSNVGTQAATGVVITDTVPAGATFNAGASTAGWWCAGSTCTFAVGSVAVGESGTVLFAVDIDAASTGALANTASITDDGANGADLTPGDDAATDSATLGPKADVSITKSDASDPVAAGAQLTYTLTVTNAGPSAAHDVSVIDTLPAGDITYVSATPSTGSCSELTGVVT
jgi:uncharacterized repeat protein (TIGR01451 family)